MSVLNRLVSYYPSISLTRDGVIINLLTVLKSDRHKATILNLRESNDEIQKELKKNLACYTVSGVFNRRQKEGIIQLSGLAAVDLDSAEGHDIPHLLNELKKLNCIAYAGLSCRGKRLFCIVPFKYPNKYEKQYQRLIQSFNVMGLPMGDGCHKQISQPRFVSWNDDSTQFFNHDAKPYSLLPPEKGYYQIMRSEQGISIPTPENTFDWCNMQVNRSHSFALGVRHKYIFQLARYCNLKGVSEQETLKGCLVYTRPDFDEKEIKEIVKHIYIKQADSHNKLPFLKPKSL